MSRYLANPDGVANAPLKLRMRASDIEYYKRLGNEPKKLETAINGHKEMLRASLTKITGGLK